MAYTAFGQSLPSGCRVADPSGWIPPAAVGGCLVAFGSQQQVCVQLAQQIASSASQPYWGLPFPQPYEAQLLNWLLNYGYVDVQRANDCAIGVASDMFLFDAASWRTWLSSACGAVQADPSACAQAGATVQHFSVPFAQWIKNAAASGAGVVLASRPTKTQIPSGSVYWDVMSAQFVAPVADDVFDPTVYGVPDVPQVQQGIRTFLSAYKAILAAREGKFGPPRELFVVYAPALANMGVSLTGLGQLSLQIPSPPALDISYPDGKGGMITVGTSVPPDPQKPPGGVPELKKPGSVPPSNVVQWTQFIAAGLGIAVAVVTLHFMLKKDKKSSTASP